MHKKTKEKMNSSISSWNEIDIFNDRYDFKQNKERLEVSKNNDNGSLSDTFLLKTKQKTKNEQIKTYFAKQDRSDPWYTFEPEYAMQACNSAFVSCFSHTAYPLGIYEKDNQEFVIWRYDTPTTQLKEKAQQHLFQHSFEEIDKVEVGFSQESFKQLDPSIRRNIIQLIVQMVFFNMYDRSYSNIMLKNNKLVHIDTQQSENYDFTTMGTNFFLFHNYKNYGVNVSKFISQLNELSQTDENLKEFISETINSEIKKIQNINYEKFIKRYLCNCITLKVSKEECYKHLKDFIKRMKNYYMDGHNLVLESIKSNKDFISKTLQNGFKKNHNNLKENKLLNEICNSDQPTQLFNTLWDKLYKEAKAKELEATYSKFKTAQLEREQECFTDYDKIKDTDRKTKKYKDKIRSFEVKKYLNIMYEKNKLYKNGNLNSKEIYKRNNHVFQKPEKQTLHNTKNTQVASKKID